MDEKDGWMKRINELVRWMDEWMAEWMDQITA